MNNTILCNEERLAAIRRQIEKEIAGSASAELRLLERETTPGACAVHVTEASRKLCAASLCDLRG